MISPSPKIPAGGVPMYKTVCAAAILLAIFVLTVSGSKGAANSTTTLPVIVARVALINQAMAIPTTTILTPAQSGVFRVSPYMAETFGSGSYTFNFNWTDDGGVPESAAMLHLAGSAGSWGTDANSQTVGSFTFRAAAGQPVSYSTSGSGGPYELFLTIERLE